MPDPRSARERTEELEHASLSAWATLSAESKGREQPAEPDPLRTAFQVDTDRILSSDSFSRLKDKSHSLLSVRGEGHRSRMEHTLAGATVARTISRALRLNEDLAEAIALGRELGATAFAAAGEDALGLFTEPAFRHNHQSVRVVECLETTTHGHASEGITALGLNLSFEVRDGIACHTMDAESPATREAEVVRVSARFVHLVDEVNDALETGVVVPRDLPVEVTDALGSDPTTWLGVLSGSVVQFSTGLPEIRVGDVAWGALDCLDRFVAKRITGRHGNAAERARGSHVLSSLVVFYRDNPRRLPAAFRYDSDPLEVRIIDYVASLSDGQALQLFGQFFLPQHAPRRG